MNHREFRVFVKFKNQRTTIGLRFVGNLKATKPPSSLGFLKI
jgi:hypothetical protein